MSTHDHRRRPPRGPFEPTAEKKGGKEPPEPSIKKLVEGFAGKGALKDILEAVSHYVDEDATVGLTHRGALEEESGGYLQTGEQRTTGVTLSPWQKKVGFSTTKQSDVRMPGDGEAPGTVDKKTYSAEASLTNAKLARKQENLEGGVENEREDSVDVSWKDGFEGSYERGKKKTVEQGETKIVTGNTMGGTIAIDGEGVKGAGKWGNIATDDAGTQTAKENTFGVGFGKGGPSFEAGKKRTVTDAEGNETSSGVAVHAGPESMGIDLSSRKDGLSTSLGVEVGGKSEAEVEALEDGRFAVSYGDSSSAGVSGGLGGASLGVKNEHTHGGKRFFATRGEAERFAIMVKLGRGPAAPTTAEGALELKPGEEVSSSGTKGGSVGGKVGGPILSVGGSASHSATDSLRVQRVDENTVEVERAKGDGDQRTMAAGNQLGGFDMGNESHGGHHEKLRFDVSTPEGKAALDRYLKGGAAPLSAPGVKLLDISETEGKSDSAHVNLGPMKFGKNEGTDHTYGIDDKGDYTEDQGHHGSSLSIPLWGHLSDNTVLSMRDQGGHTAYDLKTTVSGSDGDDINSELARGTGTYKDGNNWRSGSGKWEVETRFSEDEMDGILATMRHGGGLVGSLDGAGALDELRRAGTKDQQLRALAKLASKQGLHTLDTLRGNLRGGEIPLDGTVVTDTYVHLAGDQNFLGLAGHDAVKEQLDHLEKVEEDARDQLGADPRAALQGVGVLEAQLRQRRQAIGDPRKYTDLPDALREQELARIDEHLGRLDDAREGMIEGQAVFDREERTAANGGELEADARDYALGDQNERRFGERSLEALTSAQLDAARKANVGEALIDEDRAVLGAAAMRKMDFDVDDPKRSAALALYRKGAEMHGKAQEMRAAADRMRATQATLLRVNPAAATSMSLAIKALLDRATSMEAIALGDVELSGTAQPRRR